MTPDTEEDPGSFLTTTHPLEQDLELSTSDQDAAQAVAAGLRDAKAANTRRAYGRGWAAFTTWAEAHGYHCMPASPQSVALYLGHLAADGKSLATINQARAAISHHHAAQGIPKADNPWPSGRGSAPSSRLADPRHTAAWCGSENQAPDTGGRPPPGDASRTHGGHHGTGPGAVQRSSSI